MYVYLPVSYFNFYLSTLHICIFILFWSFILNLFIFQTFGGFPSRFWKCCFHSFICSYWFVAFSLALAVVSHLFTPFIVCDAIVDCLSSTEFLIFEPITRIISKQLDINLGPFTPEELDAVLRRIKNRKAAGLDKIPPELYNTRQFDDILLHTVMQSIIKIL